MFGGGADSANVDGPTFSAAAGVDDMKTSPSWSEPLNAVAEPRGDLLEGDVFNARKAAAAKQSLDAGRLETAGPTFADLFQLFASLCDRFVHFFRECLGR